MKNSAVIYQFAVLAGILGIIAYSMVVYGAPNEMALGALVGLAVGVVSEATKE